MSERVKIGAGGHRLKQGGGYYRSKGDAVSVHNDVQEMRQNQTKPDIPNKQNSPTNTDTGKTDTKFENSQKRGILLTHQQTI